ncbi:MAG: endonuclease MutS2 [Deltaproteobacteria bacterium]|nr:MAG: endonuclease MutS2 [Deltaproteobacteria bacterium]
MVATPNPEPFTPERAQRKVAVDLQWAELVGAIAAHCAGEDAAERIAGWWPAATLAEARERMQRTAAALEALALGEPVVTRAVPRLDHIFERVERGGVATSEELHAVAETLDTARRLRRYASARRQAVPLLWDILGSAATLDDLLAELQRAIDSSGRVMDGASGALRDARRRVDQTRRGLLDKLGQLASRYSDVLREPRHVERDGRYGLPVRADAHRRLAGIVLGSSSSGSTLFIEPPEITTLSNRLRIAEGDVEREELRVLAALSAQLQEHLEPLRVAHEACIEADVLAALSRWAQQCGGSAVLIDDEPRIELRAMRHPLLVLQAGQVVPIDMGLGSGTALVISGPNAGGKTVALKCLGLAVWMVRCGIPLPVDDGTRIGWFDEVLTNIGDEQSIERSLSTFSAEVANLGTIIERVGHQTLVLLDEVAGGTDPEEGSALAAAVLEALVDRNAAVAVTTHYERLKELAGRDERFINASVGFDFDAMAPTFQLVMGMPGASSALAVAARHGLSAAVIESAQGRLSEPSIKREELLAQLERERRGLAEARATAEQETEMAQTLRAELEVERRTVRDKERRRLEGESAELRAQIQAARSSLTKISAEPAGRGPGVSHRDVERLVDEAAKLVAIGGPLEQAVRTMADKPPLPPATSAVLTPGMQVFVERLGTTAEVVDAPARGQVRVQAGAFTLRVPVAETRLPAGKKRPAKQTQPAAQPKRSRAVPKTDDVLSRAPMRTEDNTCDLRGMRVDEALEALDRHVDQCLSFAEPAGFALHGHGTGALKQAVREHLALSSHIGRSRPAEQGEGGDAFTVFWLKD